MFDVHQRPRRILLGIGGAAALVGAAGGLARVGVPVGPLAHHGADHGPLFVVGLFATVIGLERAVALGARWAGLAPLLGAVTVAALLLQSGAARPFAVGAAATILLVAVVLFRRRPAPFTSIACAGSALLLVGNVAWLAGEPVSRVVAPWLAFLTLTIAAERLRWSRPVPAPRWAVGLLLALAAGIAGAAIAHVLGVGHADRTLGIALACLGAWQLRFDAARHTRPAAGAQGFAAVGVQAAAVWLAAGGVVLAVEGLPPAGPVYDAALHAVFVGHVIATAFAHAPTMLAAVAGVQLPFRRVMYVPVGVLHLSLAARMAGDLLGSLAWRRTGSIGNVVALGLFALVCVMAAASRRR